MSVPEGECETLCWRCSLSAPCGAALEGLLVRRFLCAVPPFHRRPGVLAQGILAGALAAAATSGALLGFGIQQGTPARPFNVVAGLLLGDDTGGIWGFDLEVTIAGVFVIVALAIGWGVLFARLGGELRGWRLAGAALAVAATALAINLLIASLRGDAFSEVLAPAQVLALHLLLGVALGVGIRLATSYLWSE